MGVNFKDSGITTSNSTQTQSQSNNGEPPPFDYVSGAERRYMTGQTIPNFHARVSRGELLPHTAFYQAEWEAQGGNGTFNSKSLGGSDKGVTYTISGFRGVTLTEPYRIMDFDNYDCEHVFTPPSDYHQSLLQRATSRIYAQGFDALTSGAEAKKTVDLLTGIARHLLSFRKTVASFDPTKIADLWLGARYGVRPIVYDLQDLHKAIYEFDAIRELYSERAGISIPFSDSRTLVSNTRVGHLTYTLTKTVAGKHSLRGSVTGRFKPSRILLDPVKTGWELIPFSFVFDWVMDIGSYLDSIMFQLLSPEWSASVGTQTDYTVTYSLVGAGNSSYSGSASADWVYEGTAQTRSPSSISFVPQVRYNQFDGWQFADILALLYQTGKYR